MTGCRPTWGRTASGYSALLGEIVGLETVTIDVDTPWRVPWELVMLGPFQACLLDDHQTVRLVTAAALVRSAVRRSTGPDCALLVEDYESLPLMSPSMTLTEAAASIVHMGWEFAAVNSEVPRLITPRCVLSALVAGGDPPARCGEPGAIGAPRQPVAAS